MPMVFYSASMIFVCLLGFIIAATIFWVWMLVDCVVNKRISDNQKAIWILVMIFTHLLGALLYLFLGRSSQKAPNSYQPYVQSQTQPAQQTPTYNSYQQGYQAVRPSPQQPGFAPPPPAVPYEQNLPLDYEQPQAMYPHEQSDND
jgi:hypothetical protein